MKVLVLGGTGMLGHKLWQTLGREHETFATLRGSPRALDLSTFDLDRAVEGVTAENPDSVVRALAEVEPEAVVNCIGIVKQAAAAADPIPSISVNSLFPHRLAEVCRASHRRLVHLSTDCVFSGRKGDYTAADVPDAEDLYGRTKLLGEVSDGNVLTLRTSMIGRELTGTNGLVEWFLSQRGGRVKGFRRAIFSGFTTIALSRVIASTLADDDLRGTWHVAAEPISKLDLLELVKRVYGIDIVIEPEENVAVDRSLDGSAFAERTGFTPPSWPEMIEEMHADPTPYDDLRSARDLSGKWAR